MNKKKCNGRNKPAKNLIAKHWKVPSDTCMACGAVARQIDRAHIMAVQCGGTHDLSNLHLLCTVCHGESEYLRLEAYEQWLELKSSMYVKGRLQLGKSLKWDYLKKDEGRYFSNLEALDNLIFFNKMKESVVLIKKR